MGNIDFINVILLLLCILIGTCVLIFISNEERRIVIRKFLLINISLSLFIIVVYYLYLERTINGAVLFLGKKQTEITNRITGEEDVKKLRDSLLIYKIELEKVNDQLREYSKYIDVKDKQSMLRTKIGNLNAQIEFIDSYNEILPKSEFSRIRKGETTSGETSCFILYPPNNLSASHLDFVLRFVNDDVVKNIACLYVEIMHKNQDGSFTLLWEEYYKPRKGCNRLRVNNYLKKKDTEMKIGFFWKNELGKNEFPKFEYVRFSINENKDFK